MHVERDTGTRAAYATLATWASFLYFVGPVTPLIAQQLGIPLQEAGLIGVALAAGVVAGGLAGPTVLRRLGRTRTGIVAAVGMSLGSGLLALVDGLPAVVAAVLLASATGSVLMTVATAALADRHGPAGPRAITEANAAAAWVGVLSPLLIGAVVGLGWGWRPAAVAVALLGLVLAAVLARHPVAEGPPAQHGLAGADSVLAAADDPAPTEGGGDAAPPPGRLSGRCYVSVVAVVAAVGAEISLNFWGGVLIAENTGVDLAAATALLAVLIGGIAVGRTLGSGLARRFPVGRLVHASLALSLIGFLVVWSAPTVLLAVTGLFLTGVGYALLFPLTSSLALQHAAGQADRAMSLVAVVIGVTMGAAPFLLGALAGSLGVRAGFLIVPVLLVAGGVAIRIAGQPATLSHVS